MIDFLTEYGLKSLVFWIIGVVILAAGYITLGLNPGQFPASKPTQWQAVFLSNNQVYFGKITNLDVNTIALSHVYYLRAASDLEQTSASLNLIKLGGELHGPDDTLFIPKRSILFWENLKESSRVVQTIEQSKQ